MTTRTRAADREVLNASRTVWALSIAVVLTLGLSWGLPMSARASSTDSAVAYQLDASHDGYQTAPITAPLTQLWSDSLPSTVGSATVTSSPLLVNGVVYVTANGELFAIQQATGDKLWTKSMGGTYDTLNIAYDAGTIFALQFGGILTAVDATTGNTLWSVQMPEQYEFEDAPVATGGIVYLQGGGDAGTIYAVSESTGTLLWTRAVENGEGSVAVDGGDVFSTEVCGYFDAFDALTGDPTWSESGSCDGGGGSTPAVADGEVFSPTDGPSAGEILSETSGAQLGPLATSLTPAVANGIVYAVSGATLTATSNSGLGTIAWSFSSSTGEFVDSPIVVGDLVFAVSADGDVYGLDAATGAEEWSDDTGQDVAGAGEYDIGGIASGEDTLLVPTGAGLIAFSGANAGSGIPANTVAATVVGSPAAGRAVGADVGVWTGLPTAYSYQWLDCGASGTSCSTIPGATGEAYTPSSAQVGTTLEVSVVATNAQGSSSAYVSSPSNPVTAGPPQNVTLPSISGSALVGHTLTASPGTWSPAATSYEYQWLRCYTSTDCQPDGTASSSNVYDVGAADEGTTIEVEVAAINAGGATLATSAPTSLVQQAFVPTTMRLISSENPAPVGATVVFTATLSSAVDGGTLAFTEDGEPLNGCTGVSMALDVAYVTCTAEVIQAGTVVIGATYSGDANYGASSAAVSEVTTSTPTQPAPTGSSNTTTSTPSSTTTSSSTTPATTVDTSVNAPLTAVLKTVSPLAAPHNLKALKTRGGYILSWARVSGARSYRLSVTIAGHKTIHTLGSGTSKYHVALGPHTRAEISLWAIGQGGYPGKARRLSLRG